MPVVKKVKENEEEAEKVKENEEEADVENVKQVVNAELVAPDKLVIAEPHG